MKSKIIINRLALVAFVLSCFLCNNMNAQSTDEKKTQTKTNNKLQEKPKPTKPKPEDNTVNNKELMQQEQNRQDSIKRAMEEQEKKRKEKQEAELVITDMFFSATNANRKKKMNKDSWVSVSDIIIKEDGVEVSKLNTKVNRENIVDKRISNSYGHVVKFSPDAKTVSITFKVTYNIERNSSSPLSLFKDHVNIIDKAKYIELRFNETMQEWEVSHIDKQSNPDDIPFKSFIINEDAAYQNIDFRLNYIFRTVNKIY
ncbi:MAG: hypothetical protein LBP85_04370 [Prevotellaceae bacterium]|jgi:hypothetical protein|nr:hypothetical protein [Prevotellaceae bacterium]